MSPFGILGVSLRTLVYLRTVAIQTKVDNYIKRISDKLRMEYGLSVIEPSKNKGKSYLEYTADKNGLSCKS